MPVAATSAAAAVKGLGVSAGVAQGLARVVLSRDGSEGLEPGEILVCHTTDPSWASYFFVAAGVVIDVGGPMSHGAIVARELGIPCVINAGNATRELQTGQWIRIDGDSGRVETLPTPSPR
jgi:pyruvate,water dikinase